MYTSMFRKAMLGDTATLNLDFTTGTLDSRLTFTRASTVATYINSSGYVTTASTNVARFDYDPVTLAPRGLLIEGENKNYFLYSSLLSNVTWQAGTGGANDVTMTYPAAGITDPSNGSNAGLLTKPNTSSGYGFFRQTNMSTGSVSGTRTISCWFKQPTTNAARYVGLRCTGNGFAPANADWCATFDLQTGTVVANVGTSYYTNVSISAYPNGWYRCSATSGSMGSATTVVAAVAIVDPYYGQEYNVIQGATYIWAPQVELGSGASSYIATGASQVTRNADSCVMTGTNFSTWFAGATEGVLFAEYEKPRSQSGNTAHDYMAVGSRYTTGAGFIVYASNSNYYPTAILWPTGGAVFGGGISTAIPSVTTQAAKWFGGNDVTNYSNGVVGTTGAGTGTVTPAMLSFGANSSTGTEATRDWLNACVRKVKFYPTALSNAEIQALTAS
jgi:hypothetical protein